MVLPPRGESSWGWTQNTMITESEDYTCNYEYYIMKHFSSKVKVGAKRLKLSGHLSGNFIAFKNPNGEIVLISKNPFMQSIGFEFNQTKIVLQLDSINIIVFRY